MDKVSLALTKVYPPAKIVVPIIKSVEKYITISTKAIIRKGIHILIQSVKPIVKQLVDKVKSTTKKIFNLLKA